MAMSNMPRPEAALKRADEHLKADQPMEALEVLHALITHRRLKSLGWDELTEKVMLRHIRLCVQLEKLKHARESLHSYRFLTYQHNAGALAKIMQELRRLSEEKLAEVKARISESEATIGDLEGEETPESLILSSVQVEVRDKTAKELHSALLCCWETYKIIMDLTRNTPKIDVVYHETAQRALQFCRDNRRHHEFRRLSDTLRLHYQHFLRQRAKPDFENFLRPETHLTTRLTQLSVAADLSLWSQCFLTAEDILTLGLHDLLARCAQAPPESTLGKYRRTLLHQTSFYYRTLAKIFRVSRQPGFHAAAVLRNVLHTRQHKKASSEEQRALADLATLSVLCIPLQENRTGVVDLQYQKKLSAMLAHSSVPTRAQMKHVLGSFGILAVASPSVQGLFELIEGPVDPLDLCGAAEKLISEIEADPELATYGPDLRHIVFDKLMVKLSTVYTSVTIEYFTGRICPRSFLPWVTAERFIVDLVKDKVVPVRLDYSADVIRFSAAAPDLEVKRRLLVVAKALSQMFPQLPGAQRGDSVAAARDAFYADFPEKLAREQERLALRNETVAALRREQEEELSAKERHRVKQEKEKQKRAEVEEQQRREAALRSQEEFRRKQQLQADKRAVCESVVEDFKAMAVRAGPRQVFIKGKAVEDVTADDILDGIFTCDDYDAAQEELKLRERQEKNRLRKMETKKFEHLVRALRGEEQSLLDEWRANTRKTDVEALLKLRAQQDAEWQAAREEAQKLRLILQGVQPDRDRWVAARLKEREEVWQKECAARLKRVHATLRRRKVERAQKRREEALQRAEEARRVAEEEERRIAAEAERQRQLEADRERDRAAMKQREKEEEIERRLKAEASERPSLWRGSVPRDRKPPPPPPSNDALEGSWRK